MASTRDREVPHDLAAFDIATVRVDEVRRSALMAAASATGE
jgi:hypothetical protein